MSTALRDRVIEMRRVKASDLAANERNFRTHPRAQAAALSDLLHDVGIAGALLAYTNEAGQLTLIDGHLRRDTAPDTEWPVLVLDVNEAEANLLLASLDPLAAMAETDSDRLAALLADVHTESAAIQEMLDGLAHGAGLDVEHLPGAGGDDFDTTPDDGPTRTQVGELWQLGRHRLMVDDCTVAANVARLVDGAKAALVYTDPPYGVDYDGGTVVREKLAGDATTDVYGAFLAVLNQATDGRAPLYLWHADPVSVPVLNAVTLAGWQIRAVLIWNKNVAQFGALSAQYKQKHEPCMYAHRKGASPYWYGPTNEVTVWEADRAASNEFHPTQKPVGLAERAMQNSSQTGDIVLDCFLGSGSTLIAAERTGRRCYGLELEPRYADVILRRWEAETGQTATRIE